MGVAPNLRARPSDRSLVADAVAGREAAFAELYDRHARRLFNLCYRVRLDRFSATRIASDAFAEVSLRLEELNLSRRNFDAYLVAAALKAGLEPARGGAERAPALPPVGEPDDAYADPARAARAIERQIELRDAVARLLPRHRTLLALRDGAGASYEEIAALLSRDVAAAANAVTRARLRLCEELEAAPAPRLAVGGDCARALPLLSLRADGAIEPAASADLAEHLRSCETCDENLAGLIEARSSYGRWLDLRPPAELRKRALSAAAGAAPRRGTLGRMNFDSIRRLAAVGATAVCALTVAAGLMLSQGGSSGAQGTAGGSALDGGGAHGPGGSARHARGGGVSAGGGGAAARRGGGRSAGRDGSGASGPGGGGQHNRVHERSGGNGGGGRAPTEAGDESFGDTPPTAPTDYAKDDPPHDSSSGILSLPLPLVGGGEGGGGGSVYPTPEPENPSRSAGSPDSAE